jgi:hypothetical protein
MTNISAIAAKLSEHRHQWVENIIRENVPHWKIIVVEVTRSQWLARHLIGVRIESRQAPSIHRGAKTCMQTRVYIKDKLIGEYKEFINAKRTNP